MWTWFDGILPKTGRLRQSGMADLGALAAACALIPYMLAQNGFSMAFVVVGVYVSVWAYKAWFNSETCGFWFPTITGVGPDGVFSLHWPSYGFSFIVFCVMVMSAVLEYHVVDINGDDGMWMGYALAAAVCARFTFPPMLMSHAWAAAYTRQSRLPDRA